MLRTPSSNPAIYVNLASVYHNIGIYLLSAQNKRKIPAIIKPQEPGGHRPRQGEMDDEEPLQRFSKITPETFHKATSPAQTVLRTREESKRNSPMDRTEPKSSL